MPDRIHLTVATVVERQGRYLTVAEHSDNGLVYNQPAGHVEPGERLIDAAVRETLEETAWQVQPYGLINLSTYNAANGTTYYRVCFAAQPVTHEVNRELDSDIESVHWLRYDELAARASQLRSPLVLQAIKDFRAGCIHSLGLLRE